MEEGKEEWWPYCDRQRRLLCSTFLTVSVRHRFVFCSILTFFVQKGTQSFVQTIIWKQTANDCDCDGGEPLCDTRWREQLSLTTLLWVRWQYGDNLWRQDLIRIDIRALKTLFCWEIIFVAICGQIEGGGGSFCYFAPKYSLLASEIVSFTPKVLFKLVHFSLKESVEQRNDKEVQLQLWPFSSYCESSAPKQPHRTSWDQIEISANHS